MYIGEANLNGLPLAAPETRRLGVCPECLTVVRGARDGAQCPACDAPIVRPTPIRPVLR